MTWLQKRREKEQQWQKVRPEIFFRLYQRRGTVGTDNRVSDDSYIVIHVELTAGRQGSMEIHRNSVCCLLEKGKVIEDS